MADNSVIILNTPLVGAVSISEDIEIIKQGTFVKEYNKRSEVNTPNIEKKGNFTEWEFRIYQKDKSDADWLTFIAALEALNTGELLSFSPDTVDFATDVYQCYCFFKYDDKNLYPNDFIWSKIYRYYANGQEV